MLRATHNAIRTCRAAAIVAAWSWSTIVAAGQEPFWDTEPYRIEAVLALDVPGGVASKLADTLPIYLKNRAEAAAGPAWDFQAQLAAGALRPQVLKHLAQEIVEPPPDTFPSENDKLLLLAVRQTADGYELIGREFDRIVQRWGMPIERRCRQHQALAEQLFALACQVVAPVARLELDPDDEKRVTLQLRAGRYAPTDDDAAWVKPGNVFLPLLRRTTRGGNLLPGGVQAIPWTYIEVTEVDAGKITGRIHSGSHRPFGVRRRGRIEQVAIALRADPGTTSLQLKSRTKIDKPLIGYEVHSRNTDEESTTPVGASDLAGRVEVPPGRTRLQMLFIKSGSELLARLPIVPGAERQIEVPLPDDEARLQAEARLSALREELVDIVVRRNILTARAKQKIEAKDWDKAQELLRTLDQLPGRAQFNLALSKEARLLRSDDPQIQRRIDRLVEATQVVLGQYLDNRPISELHNELRAAQREGT